VPSPILVGLIKDSLAPGCIPNEDDDGEGAATSQDCRDDAAGIRLTILLVNLWLFWCVFFFTLAWFLNRFYRHAMENCTYCMPNRGNGRGPGLCCFFAHRCPELCGLASADDGDEEQQEQSKETLLTKSLLAH
jgi:hypothetical protein